MTAQTEQKSRDLARSLVDYEYFSPGSNMTASQLVDKYDHAIQELISQEVLSVLHELEKSATFDVSGNSPLINPVYVQSIKNRYKL